MVGLKSRHDQDEIVKLPRSVKAMKELTKMSANAFFGCRSSIVELCSMMGVATAISVSPVFCVHLSSKDTSKNMQASLHSSKRTRHGKERGSFRRNVMSPLCLCSIFDSFDRPSSCTSTPLRHAFRARSAVVRLAAARFIGKRSQTRPRSLRTPATIVTRPLAYTPPSAPSNPA